MPTMTKPKPKPKTVAEINGELLAQREVGVQISLRLPRGTLAKLTRLSQASFQTKSQYITKLIHRINE